MFVEINRDIKSTKVYKWKYIGKYIPLLNSIAFSRNKKQFYLHKQNIFTNILLSVILLIIYEFREIYEREKERG